MTIWTLPVVGAIIVLAWNVYELWLVRRRGKVMASKWDWLACGPSDAESRVKIDGFEQRLATMREATTFMEREMEAARQEKLSLIDHIDAMAFRETNTPS